MIQQTTQQKVLAVGGGLSGIGLSLVEIASIAQAVGMIVGALLITGQFVIFILNQYKRFRKRHHANDK